MILLELFSGIGGFSKDMDLAGYLFDKIYFHKALHRFFREPPGVE